MKSLPALVFFSLALLLAVLYVGTRHDVLVVSFLAAGIVLAATLVAHRNTRSTFVTLLDATLLAFGTWLLVAVLLSEVPSISANSALGLALFFLGYGMTRTAATNHGFVQWVVHLVALTGAGLVAWALWQFLGGMESPRGPFINRNNFAALIFLCSMFAGAALYAGHADYDTRQQRWRILTLGGFALFTFLVIGLIGSRGALLGAFVAIALLGYLSRRRLRPVLAYTLGAGAGLTVSALLSNLHVVQRLSTLADPELAGASRFRIWESVLPLITEKPWFGHGPGTLFLVWGPHRHPQDSSGGFHAHNDLLAFAVSAGIPAAILFATVIVIALWTVIRHARTHPEDPAMTRNAWLGAGLAGVSLHAMFTFNFSIASILLLCGVILGCIVPFSMPLQSRPVLALMRIGRVVAVFVVLGLSVYATTSFVGYYHHLVAERAEREGDMNGAFEAATKAIRWWPSADSWRVQRAHIVLSGALEADDARANPNAAGAFQLARADADKALQLNPYRQAAYQTAARVQLAGARLGLAPDGEAAAEELLREGLERSPRNLLTRYRLATLLEQRDKAEAALEVVLGGMGFWYPRTSAREEFYQYAHELAQRLGDENAAAAIPDS